DIKEFFWKWRRHHYPQSESSLTHGSGNLLRRGETGMANLGVFGALVVEEFASKRAGAGPGAGGPAGGFGGGGFAEGRNALAAAPSSALGGEFQRGLRQDADGKKAADREQVG